MSTNASVDTLLFIAETVIVGPRLSDFFSLVTTPCTVVVHSSSAAVNSAFRRAHHKSSTFCFLEPSSVVDGTVRLVSSV